VQNDLFEGVQHEETISRCSRLNLPEDSRQEDVWGSDSEIT